MKDVREAMACAAELREVLAELGVEVLAHYVDARSLGDWRAFADLPFEHCIYITRVDVERAPWPWWLRWLRVLPRTRLEWAIELTDHGYGQAWAMGPNLRRAVVDCVRLWRAEGNRRLTERLAELKQWDE